LRKQKTATSLKQRIIKYSNPFGLEFKHTTLYIGEYTAKKYDANIYPPTVSVGYFKLGWNNHITDIYACL